MSLTGKPEQQRSSAMDSVGSRQRSAISGRPFRKQTHFGPAVCSSTDSPMPQTTAL